MIRGELRDGQIYHAAFGAAEAFARFGNDLAASAVNALTKAHGNFELDVPGRRVTEAPN